MLPDQAVTNSVRGFSKELANMWVIAPFFTNFVKIFPGKSGNM